MANLLIVPDKILTSGVAVTELASTVIATGVGHNTFQNTDDLVWMWVQSQTATLSLTVYNQQVIDGIPGPDKVVTMATPMERYFGPWPPAVFNDPNGLVHFNFNTLANVFHCMLFRVPRHTSF